MRRTVVVLATGVALIGTGYAAAIRISLSSASVRHLLVADAVPEELDQALDVVLAGSRASWQTAHTQGLEQTLSGVSRRNFTRPTN